MIKKLYRTLLFLTLSLWGLSASAQNNCPTWEWADDLMVNPGNGIIKMVGDTAGNLYAMGSFTGSITFGAVTLTTTDTSFYIAKYSKSRTWTWGVQFEAQRPGRVFRSSPVDMHLLHDTLLTITGNFFTTAIFDTITLTSGFPNTSNVFVAQLNVQNQQWRWATKAEAAISITAHSVIADNVGNAFITGLAWQFNPTTTTLNFGSIPFNLDSNMVFIASLSANGSWQWIKKVSRSARTSSVAVNNAGEPVVMGTFSSRINFANQTVVNPGNNFSYYLAGFSSTGQELWLKTIRCNSNIPPLNYRHIAYDDFNNLYVGGPYSNSLYFDQDTLNSNLTGNFIAKLNPNKQWSWTRNVGEAKPGSGIIGLRSFLGKTSDVGETYITGMFNGELKIGNDSIKSGSLLSLLVSKIDSAGDWQWAGVAYPDRYQNFSAQGPVGISFDLIDNTYIMGRHSQTTYFGYYSVANQGHYAAKIKPDSLINLKLPKDTLLYCGQSFEIKPRTTGVGQLYYSWSPGYGLNDSTVQNPVASPDTTTTYTVVAYNGNGCSTSGQITIRKDSVPWFGAGFQFTTSTGGTTFCSNSGLSISGPSYFTTYHWNTGDTSATIVLKKPGTYILTATDTGGCYRKDSIVIRPPASIISQNLLLCHNDSVLLNMSSTNIDSLIWYDGSTINQKYVDQAGTYWVTIYKNNCVFTDSIEVIPFSDTANASFTYTNNGLTATFKPVSIGIAKGFWNFGDGNVMNGITAIHTYASYGTYQVCYQTTDVCGFTDYKCDSITIAPISLPELKKPTEFSIYPNPGNGLLNIECTDYGSHQLKLIDLSGKVLLEKKLNNNTHWEINLSHLPQGCYFIRINNQTKTFVKN